MERQWGPPHRCLACIQLTCWKCVQNGHWWEMISTQEVICQDKAGLSSLCLGLCIEYQYFFGTGWNIFVAPGAEEAQAAGQIRNLGYLSTDQMFPDLNEILARFFSTKLPDGCFCLGIFVQVKGRHHIGTNRRANSTFGLQGNFSIIFRNFIDQSDVFKYLILSEQHCKTQIYSI